MSVNISNGYDVTNVTYIDWNDEVAEIGTGQVLIPNPNVIYEGQYERSIDDIIRKDNGDLVLIAPVVGLQQVIKYNKIISINHYNFDNKTSHWSYDNDTNYYNFNELFHISHYEEKDDDILPF